MDRSIQTVVSCLFNPENRLRNSLVTQDDYFKYKRVHHFRRSRAVLKSDHLCAGADYKDDDDKLDGYPYDVPDYAAGAYPYDVPDYA